MVAQGLNSELLLQKRLYSAGVRDDAPDACGLRHTICIFTVVAMTQLEAQSAM